MKRNFIKALCQDIESQMSEDNQRVIGAKDAEKGLDAAIKAIQQDDVEE